MNVLKMFKSIFVLCFFGLTVCTGHNHANGHESAKILSKRQTNLCSMVFCQNGGTCFFSNNLATCKCVTGFYGMYCQFRRNNQVTNLATTRNPFQSTTTPLMNPTSPCAYITCQNGGICNSPDGSRFICECRQGFSGQFCQNVGGLTQAPTSGFDICAFKNCRNGGICNKINTFTATCECANGWTGETCEIPTSFDICALKNCQNGGICSKSGIFTAVCVCPLGYSGESCEIPPFDVCTTMNCQNNATCLAVNPFFAYCICLTGFTGRYCERRITTTISYGQPCNDPQLVCNATKGLICPLITSTNCNCPLTSTVGLCDCLPNQYWDGISCVNRKDHNQTCANNYECMSDMYCRSDTKLCTCNGYRSIKQSKCLDCPRDMKVFDESGIFYQNKCYYLLPRNPPENLSFVFNDSKRLCEEYGPNTSLMRIQNDIENDIAEVISVRYNNSQFWLDSFVKAKNDTYLWGDNSLVEQKYFCVAQPNYLNGAGNPPFQSGLEFTNFAQAGSLNDTYCINDQLIDIPRYFVCEYSA